MDAVLQGRAIGHHAAACASTKASPLSILAKGMARVRSELPMT